jgi:hypothetical protein
MRHTVLLALAATIRLSGAAAGQEPATATPATLLSGLSSFSGYFGIGTRISRVNGATGVFPGAEAVLLIDHRFAIGLEGYALANDEARVQTVSGARRLSMGYGGFLVGYAAQPSGPVHPTFDLLLGGGSVNAGDDPDGSGSDRIFVLEPALGVEISVAPAFHLGIAASYRYVADVQLAQMRPADLRALSAQFVVRVGKF